MLLRLSEIAERLPAVLEGPDREIQGIQSLEDAGPDSLSLCLDGHRVPDLTASRAAGVLVPTGLRERVLAARTGCSLLWVEHPRAALARALGIFHPTPAWQAGRHPTAYVDSAVRAPVSVRVDALAKVMAGAELGERVWIESGAYIGEGCRIGDDSRIGVNAVITGASQLGRRVEIGPGSVIGSPGFGVTELEGRLIRIPQVGRVVIEDEVEIGANCAIDRATFGVTRIGRGSKLDNLIQVGHNVDIGENVIVAAQCGFSGSVHIGERALFGGQVGVADHIQIGANSQVGAQSGVGTRVPPGERMMGTPAVPVAQWLKGLMVLRRLGRTPPTSPPARKRKRKAT